MKITVLQPPPFEPVTLAEVHKHLRLDLDGSPASHPDDDMLQRLIATARGQVESMARRSLVQRTLRLSVEAFGDAVRLVRPPVLRVESVTYFDTSNVLQVLDPATYFVTDDEVPELLMANGASAPSTYSRPDALRIEYVAGYAPDGSPATTQADYAGGVPSELKDAILLSVQLLYDSLAPNERTAIENMREALIQPLRVQLTV